MNSLLKIGIGAGMLFGASAATAQEAGSENGGWTYRLQLYLWATEVGTTVGGKEVTLGFDEIIENLNVALMGGLQAYNGKWMTYGELSYASLRQGGEASFTISPGEGPGLTIDAVADADIETTIVSFGAGYQLVDKPDYTMYGTFGVRYLGLDLEADVDIARQSFHIDEGDDVWDAVVGLSGEARFGENWFVPWIVDVGTGQSDLTWQAGAGIGYRFGRNDLVLGYRHMEWDLPDDQLVTNYYQSGPILLWNFRF